MKPKHNAEIYEDMLIKRDKQIEQLQKKNEELKEHIIYLWRISHE